MPVGDNLDSNALEPLRIACYKMVRLVNLIYMSEFTGAEFLCLPHNTAWLISSLRGTDPGILMNCFEERATGTNIPTRTFADRNGRAI
jgi:hypothetical protein